MADYAFGEVTRLLYDAIWNEFCDWGVELAKVRLADASLSDDVREATWWTLVEALDTYLRLLHPVMPFVTEALWAAIPHRASDPDLLIVARWPAHGQRDLAVETEVSALIGLVGDLRNARATAKLPAGDWLATRVYVPAEPRPDLRNAPPGPRAPGAGAAAGPRSSRPRRWTRPANRVTSRSSAGAGEIEATIRPTAPDCRRARPRTRPARTRAGRGRDLVGGRQGAAGERGVHGQGSARGRRGCAGPRGGARRAGRPAAGRPRRLTARTDVADCDVVRPAASARRSRSPAGDPRRPRPRSRRGTPSRAVRG